MTSKSDLESEAKGEDNEGAATSNDLIINEGFPALNNFRLPKETDNKRDETPQGDPVPRYPFGSFARALSIGQNNIDNMVHDCDLAFTARAKEENDAYSSGATFFMPASMKPRCALEQLALQIFQTHTKGLEPGKHFDIERSGAEWWTLVLDTNSNSSVDKEKPEKPETDDNSESSEEEEDDEVGMHFDADYGLEHQLPNYLLHPRIATVTYLSNVGVPTLVLNKRSPPPTDVEKKSLNGSIDQAWLSCPMIGKHIAFDGRLLHGAPGFFFPSFNQTVIDTAEEEEDEDKPPSKKRKLENDTAVCSNTNENNMNMGTKRITFMVNIWLNHCPIDADLIDETLCSQMKTKWELDEKLENGARLKGDEDDAAASMTWALNDVSESDKLDIEEIKIAANESDYAGREECVICNREVEMKCSSTMANLHNASKKAQDANGKSLTIKFEPDAFQLEVGKEVEDSDEDESDGDN